jgi:hypothetical protein
MRGFPYIAIDPKCLEGSPEARYFARNTYCIQERARELLASKGCPDSCSNCLVEIPYEVAGKIILDPVEGRITCDFLLMWEGSGEGLYIKEGTRSYVIETAGHRIHSIVSEGETVRSGSKIAYISTGKGEVRTVRADVEGVIAYIYQDLTSKPEKLLFIVVGGENVRRIRIF